MVVNKKQLLWLVALFALLTVAGTSGAKSAQLRFNGTGGSTQVLEADGTAPPPPPIPWATSVASQIS